MIDRSDAYGDSVIDFVHRGGNVYLTFNCLAFKTGSVNIFYPWTTFGRLSSTADPIGRLASDESAAFVLTAVSNTTANTSTPAVSTLTATYTTLAPNSNLRLLFSSRVRKVPIRLIVLPESAGGGTYRWFTTA